MKLSLLSLQGKYVASSNQEFTNDTICVWFTVTLLTYWDTWTEQITTEIICSNKVQSVSLDTVLHYTVKCRLVKKRKFLFRYWSHASSTLLHKMFCRSAWRLYSLTHPPFIMPFISLWHTISRRGQHTIIWWNSIAVLFVWIRSL